MKWWLLGLLMLSIFGGCGKKAPPRPKDVPVPQPISDLEGVVLDGNVVLKWSVPRVASEEPNLAALKEFKVLRQKAPLGEDWCESCPEQLELHDRLKTDEQGNFSLSGERVVYQDARVAFGHVYVYRVVSQSRKGYESSLSNRAVVFWDKPPRAPSHIEGTAGDGSVVLRWAPVERGEGYRIYRKQEGKAFSDAPVAVMGPEAHTYRDTGLSNDLAYVYVVRATRRVGKTWLEGPGSQEVSLIPKDLIPPETPKGLMAIPLADGVELSWQRSTEPDLLGYFVYRRDPGEGQYSPLNEVPLQAPTYLDQTADLGQSYEYVVTAVDRSPQRNESVFSESVVVTYVR